MVPPPSQLRMEAGPGSEMLCSLEYWMMESSKAQNLDGYLVFCVLKI